MAKLIHGERIGKTATVMVGSSATIFDETGQRILLTRRTDNQRWCLPGGRLDPGESIAECCAREVWEETGLCARIVKLIGVYTTPDFLLEYGDGNRFQLISFNFEAIVIGGTLGLSDETIAYGYYSPAEIEELDLMEHHRQRIVDAFAGLETTFVR